MSSLDVGSVSVSSSELRLVYFCDSLVGSLNSLHSMGAGELGPDSGMSSVSGFSLPLVPAEWPFTAMR